MQMSIVKNIKANIFLFKELNRVVCSRGDFDKLNAVTELDITKEELPKGKYLLSSRKITNPQDVNISNSSQFIGDYTESVELDLFEITEFNEKRAKDHFSEVFQKPRTYSKKSYGRKSSRSTIINNEEKIKAQHTLLKGKLSKVESKIDRK